MESEKDMSDEEMKTMKGKGICKVGACCLCRMTRAHMNADGKGSSGKEESLMRQEGVGACL